MAILLKSIALILNEGPDGGGSHQDSRVDFVVNHDSQKINFHDHGSQNIKK